MCALHRASDRDGRHTEDERRQDRGVKRSKRTDLYDTERARENQVHYSASKAAVIALTRCCAEAWAGRGIRINCVSPGLTRTEMADTLSPEVQENICANTPMGRNGDPADLQGAAIYLASSASSYVTGHDLVVDGGYTIW